MSSSTLTSTSAGGVPGGASSSSSAAAAASSESKFASPLLTEVPSSLKQLARLVVRGFYVVEDALIVDMLVRYPCMREEDLAELLKFDRKMLRAKMAGLKNDKIVQVKQRIETDVEGKVTRMNCYFINYKIFVNIVKYKLDHMHKKMETNERDATTRSSFKCQGCSKTFTDLEADQLFDHQTLQFRCTFCSSAVEEDESAGPQSDSRQLLAKFNTQMEKLYELLRAVENISLAPSVLEPEPVEINFKGRANAGDGNRGNIPDGARWSGDVTRSGGGFRLDEQNVNITFGDGPQEAESRREMPIWMQQSTVTQDAESGLLLLEDDSNSADGEASTSATAAATAASSSNNSAGKNDHSDEITSLLLRHEKRSAPGQPFIPRDSESDKSDDSDVDESSRGDPILAGLGLLDNTTESNDYDAAETMSDDDDDGGIPTVKVGEEEITLTDVNEEIIARMTAQEKERYMQVFQDFYAHMYD